MRSLDADLFQIELNCIDRKLLSAILYYCEEANAQLATF